LRRPAFASIVSLSIAAILGVGAGVAPAGASQTGVQYSAVQPTVTETGNPIEDQGSNYDYRSYITSVTPDASGLSLQVLEFADRLLLTNHTGKTVTIYGYDDEPYARVLADGTAEQNERSPATYLNTNFYGQVSVPVYADASAAPRWQVIDRTGQFEWHDHRIHWMSPVAPAWVKGSSKRTLIFDWHVPIAVGAQKGYINGQLFWTPETSKASPVVVVLGVAIALLGLAFAVFVRRRRRRGGAAAAGASGGGAGGGGVGDDAW
jgi:LPXTG-motif cell wall-anchored protein